ncbi:hypothetical protein BD779DRAFT_1502276, partial [Infundibulicybe gibba]
VALCGALPPLKCPSFSFFLEIQCLLPAEPLQCSLPPSTSPIPPSVLFPSSPSRAPSNDAQSQRLVAPSPTARAHPIHSTTCRGYPLSTHPQTGFATLQTSHSSLAPARDPALSPLAFFSATSCPYPRPTPLPPPASYDPHSDPSNPFFLSCHHYLAYQHPNLCPRVAYRPPSYHAI